MFGTVRKIVSAFESRRQPRPPSLSSPSSSCSSSSSSVQSGVSPLHSPASHEPKPRPLRPVSPNPCPGSTPSATVNRLGCLSVPPCLREGPAHHRRSRPLSTPPPLLIAEKEVERKEGVVRGVPRVRVRDSWPIGHQDCVAQWSLFSQTIPLKSGKPKSSSTTGPRTSCTMGPKSSSTTGPRTSCTMGPKSSSTTGPRTSCTMGPKSSSTAGASTSSKTVTSSGSTTGQASVSTMSSPSGAATAATTAHTTRPATSSAPGPSQTSRDPAAAGHQRLCSPEGAVVLVHHQTSTHPELNTSQSAAPRSCSHPSPTRLQISCSSGSRCPHLPPVHQQGRGGCGSTPAVVKSKWEPKCSSEATFLSLTLFCQGGSNNSMVAIDNKIEQAMDLVKTHLMMAVREEVELLREQIKELTERNAQLERENYILKALRDRH